MSVVKIRAALESWLQGQTPLLDTMWENGKPGFTPQADVPYQRVHLLLAEPENPVFGDGFYRQPGILQVTLAYPLEEGPANAASRAELLRARFARGTSLTSGGVTVKIHRTPEIGPGMIHADRYELPVSIRFYADLFD